MKFNKQMKEKELLDMEKNFANIQNSEEIEENLEIPHPTISREVEGVKFPEEEIKEIPQAIEVKKERRKEIKARLF
ncbi:TPA: hypothetical protein DEG21_04255 [Patescibacteria group bacterium]|nr:hypothetical protein [Candidatus Gracilibacteria bacterium]HBY75055.1 hypothetical protein [Candidatus Gracilibacteria bacterium]